jgi:hypothetical protein
MKIGDVVKYKDKEWKIFVVDSELSKVFLSRIEDVGTYLSSTIIEIVNFSEFLSKNDSCEHKLVNYIGFTESYSYCTLCDYKE